MFEDLERSLADLVVVSGANVQPGQIVAVGSEPGKESLTRAVAESAYRHGARFVDVNYFDPWVKRARLLHAGEDTLDFVPSWYGERVLALGDQHCARIALSGNAAPGLLDDVDPVRAGKDMLPWVKETAKLVGDSTTNWSIVPAPTAGWASLVHPEREPRAALEQLWEQIAHVCRLDEVDAAAAWNERFDALSTVAERLTARRFDMLHFEGPGTDLRVGLLPTSRWLAARMETVDGVVHLPNLPSEEVFSSPDPQRTEGWVTSTKPLDLQGTTVRGLRVRFEGGRAVDVQADTGAEALRARTGRDEGAARLGEVALVDGEGRIGTLDTIFYDTLLDENAASHIALGRAYPMGVEEPDMERINDSSIHIDFMIGGPGVQVSGVTPEGDRVPVLVDGAWQV